MKHACATPENRDCGSLLALVQAVETRSRLMAAYGMSDLGFEIVVISTSGDRVQDRPLPQAGGKGLFTKELEEALTKLPNSLELVAFLPRDDPRDAFVGKMSRSVADLPHGSRPARPRCVATP